VDQDGNTAAQGSAQEDDDDSGSSNQPAAPRHLVFVDDAAAAKAFDPVAHFETVPALLDRPANRLRARQLAAAPLPAAAATENDVAVRGEEEASGWMRC
jgi:hypothetical protein